MINLTIKLPLSLKKGLKKNIDCVYCGDINLYHSENDSEYYGVSTSIITCECYIHSATKNCGCDITIIWVSDNEYWNKKNNP